MAHVELTDEELIDLIIDRAHLIPAAFAKLQADIDDRAALETDLWSALERSRAA